MKIETFFDQNTATFTHIIIDAATSSCAVIDSVQDFDPNSGKLKTTSADKIINFIQSNNLKLEWVLETHIHADHLTAGYYLISKLGGKIGMGSRITEVLDYWIPIFNSSVDTEKDGSQFDHLFHDNETFNIGNIEVKVIHTPGHTPACVSYLIDDSIFVGDSIFMPHLGTARADFPGGDAAVLYDSIKKILSLPDSTKIYVCHDYPEQDKKARCLTTVQEQKETNIMINKNVTKTEFIKRREARDKTLPTPKLLLASIQTNMRCGKKAEVEDNEISYIKIPLNQL